MSEDLHRAIARVRRAMPRNEDVMAICDALETKLTTRQPTVSTERFDRKSYMRDYMRGYRKRKTNGNSEHAQ